MKVFIYIYMVLFSLCIISCGTWHEVISYNLQSTDNTGIVTKKDMTITFDKFIAGYTPEGHIQIYNTSDSTMYIDMGESYYLDKSGQATRLYSNAITSQFNSGTTNGSLNLGSIAGAFGLGGVAGTLAQGITIGGGNTNGTSIQTFEDRYISIPPKSNRAIKFINLDIPSDEGEKGYHVDYDINSSPFAIGHHLTYTFNPNGQDWKNTRNIMYIDGMTWTKNKKEFNDISTEEDVSLVKRQGITTASIGGWIGGTVCILGALIGGLSAL